MSRMNRTSMRTEVKSKIGDYIRGKISAQSLMHPSRVNTKPIDKRQYSLNTNSFRYQMTRTEYQRKVRRPPLKDYIEGKVKLSDMISPSKITHIPRERKYPPEVKRLAFNESMNTKCNRSFEESIKLVQNDIAKPATTAEPDWRLTSYRSLFKPSNGTEYSLIPLRPTNLSSGRRKFMCKIKRIQKTGNTCTNDEHKVTEERIIEVPEALWRQKQNVPKFLMDRYNIPCFVDNKPAVRKHPLAILDDSATCERATAKRGEQSETQYADVEDENSVMVEAREPGKPTSTDVGNVPAEQGDYNNTTTYILEFYEEDASREQKSAIIEEVEDDHKRDRIDRSYADKSDCFSETRGERFQQYEDFKSQILLQRELLDLHRSMLKCDKNVMVVEHNVNQVTATLNTIESVQNQEIKPIVMNMKSEYDNLKLQIDTLQEQNQKLKTTLRGLRKKTSDYEKLMCCMSESSNTKIQELEKKLQTITQAQMKSIEMQNLVNKNMFRITHQMKRTCSELDSRHCYSTIIKSPKNYSRSSFANSNNLSVTNDDCTAMTNTNVSE